MFFDDHFLTVVHEKQMKMMQRKFLLRVDRSWGFVSFLFHFAITSDRSPCYFSQVHIFFEECEMSRRSLQKDRKCYKEKKSVQQDSVSRSQAYSAFLIISGITVNLTTFLGHIWHIGRVRMQVSLFEIFYIVLKGLYKFHSKRDCFCYVTVPCFC